MKMSAIITLLYDVKTFPRNPEKKKPHGNKIKIWLFRKGDNK